MKRELIHRIKCRPCLLWILVCMLSRSTVIAAFIEVLNSVIMSSDLIDKLRREFPSQQHAEAVNVSQDRHVSNSVDFNEPSLTGQWSRKKKTSIHVLWENIQMERDVTGDL